MRIGTGKNMIQSNHISYPPRISKNSLICVTNCSKTERPIDICIPLHSQVTTNQQLGFGHHFTSNWTLCDLYGILWHENGAFSKQAPLISQNSSINFWQWQKCKVQWFPWQSERISMPMSDWMKNVQYLFIEGYDVSGSLNTTCPSHICKRFTGSLLCRSRQYIQFLSGTWFPRYWSIMKYWIVAKELDLSAKSALHLLCYVAMLSY